MYYSMVYNDLTESEFSKIICSWYIMTYTSTVAQLTYSLAQPPNQHGTQLTHLSRITVDHNFDQLLHSLPNTVIHSSMGQLRALTEVNYSTMSRGRNPNYLTSVFIFELTNIDIHIRTRIQF